MADWENDQRRIDAACEAVLRIPAVHTVYVGRRYRNGRKTDELALCVLVRRKKPLEQVAPSDRVPREVAGIPTDVIDADPPQLLQLEGEGSQYTQPSQSDLPTFDDTEYPRLRGGIACEGGGGFGTLGLIALATDSTNKGKVVLLSNHHVLVAKGTGAGTTVRHPRESCFCCGRKIGVVLRSRKTNTGAYYLKHPNVPNLDAAIALLDPGVEALAEIQRGVGNAGGTDLVRGVLADASIVEGLAVQKRGARTGLTTGTIERGMAWAKPKDDSEKATAFRRQLLIDPGFPTASTKGIFRFGAGGDSGSVVMTQAGGQVLGLLWASVPSWPGGREKNPDLVVVKGIASRIGEVISELQIEIKPPNEPNSVLVNPVSRPASQPTSQPTSQPVQPQPVPRSMLKNARAEIEQTRYGSQYVDLVRRHHTEVRQLVRTNRRVGAIWQRYGGQRLLQSIIDAVSRPDEPFPSIMGPYSVSEVTARIATILKRYGSRELAHDVDAYLQSIASICGLTYNQLLARLRNGEPLVS